MSPVSQVAQLHEANATLAKNNESLLREIETPHLTIDPAYLAQASETQSSPTSTAGLQGVGPDLTFEALLIFDSVCPCRVLHLDLPQPCD
ncbi:hypothetical protein EJ05DRAFT_481087 [Pseudovirgaria hyperparasitica]|uniref:Uncharacterized protein n=1 Tax=Pseudovirgaria hyperparasitica TaxID=470096 RepID=A0A6A6VRY3_9PEZI|nr:uncharacterized protein EJ05DRAFT_481087 [Pseudovirgaria hyperparasitica]KAF2752669.1 hypothetical protein EJ05DRAFT_481087 [Pseudovirgaria hyperparasitica]